MTFRFSGIRKTDDGNAAIDWVVLVTGVVLLAVSIIIVVVPHDRAISDGTPDHAEQIEDIRPA